jgi:tRNA pseudouridine38-40 synthase
VGRRGQEEAGRRRLALLVEYQGTAYGGSQLQANTQTIQGALERALSSLTGESIRLALAGRTDAGVHALGQVASFLTDSRLPLENFERGTNALLPDDISVRAAAETPREFDPRRHALSRWYRYTLHLGRARAALRREFVWEPPFPHLDIEAIAEAAGFLAGTHDFAAFTQAAEAARRVTQRNVLRSSVCSQGRFLRIDIEANAFLLQMVRRIVGSLVEVGARKLAPAEFGTLLRQAPPGAAKLVAPARGLCLMKVRYENGLFDDETDEYI